MSDQTSAMAALAVRAVNGGADRTCLPCAAYAALSTFWGWPPQKVRQHRGKRENKRTCLRCRKSLAGMSVLARTCSGACRFSIWAARRRKGVVIRQVAQTKRPEKVRTVATYWPSRRLRDVFPRARQIVVWTCAWHAKGPWPLDLYMALAAETEGLATAAVAPLSALDDLLRAKAAGRVPHSPRMYGAWPGEDLAAVLAAYQEAGTHAGAGRLLDQRGVPTRSGRPWSGSSLRALVERATLRGLIGTTSG